MAKYMLLSTLYMLYIFPAYGQEWIARYSGPDSTTDIAHDIAVDNIGNVYVTGQSINPNTGDDYATIKYDSLGNQLWIAYYNGPANDFDAAYEVAVDSAGNVYVTGKSNGNNFDYATIKYDSAGNELWVNRYDGPNNWQDAAWALTLDNKSNVYVTGRSSGNYTTIKYDSLGVEQWVARYYGPNYNSGYAYDIAVDNIGNVYVTGSIGAPVLFDWATVKYDSMGNEQWDRVYGSDIHDDGACAIAVDNAGNVYVTGYSWSDVTSFDYTTIKYDSSGTQCWIARYNGPANDADLASAMIVDDMGNVYITGYSWDTLGYPNCRNYATVKYNTFGEQLWAARYSYIPYVHNRANDIALDSLGNVYVTGYSAADYTTIRYDSVGNEHWVGRYNGFGYDEAFAITVDNAGNFYITGQSAGERTGYDYLTIKYSATTGVTAKKVVSVKNITIYPTILSGPLLLPADQPYKIFDITGRQIHTLNPTPGIYFIEVGGEIRQKVIKIK
jgi:hypothetical protein